VKAISASLRASRLGLLFDAGLDLSGLISEIQFRLGNRCRGFDCASQQRLGALLATFDHLTNLAIGGTYQNCFACAWFPLLPRSPPVYSMRGRDFQRSKPSDCSPGPRFSTILVLRNEMPEPLTLEEGKLLLGLLSRRPAL